jgi:hypothetical protein
MDEDGLREKAGEAIRTGRLPAQRPGRIWGGPGGGGECAICGSQLSSDEMELELEFAVGSHGTPVLKHCVHVHCFAAWELELLGGQALADSLSEANGDGTIRSRGRNQTYKPGSV